MKIFEVNPKISTKIVLATNIAEASLTIPNVSIVIDEGTELTS
jgi:HrpA-like RNA helicase